MRHKPMCVLIIGGFLVFGGGGGLGSPQPLGSGIGGERVNQAQVRRAQEVLAAHEARLMEIPGVVGVGVGMTEQGDRAAIQVFVNVVATGGRVPEVLPQQLEGVPVRVIHTDAIKAR
jgi:hypothetical protein